MDRSPLRPSPLGLTGFPKPVRPEGAVDASSCSGAPPRPCWGSKSPARVKSARRHWHQTLTGHFSRALLVIRPERSGCSRCRAPHAGRTVPAGSGPAAGAADLAAGGELLLQAVLLLGSLRPGGNGYENDGAHCILQVGAPPSGEPIPEEVARVRAYDSMGAGED